jgi:hypothetical protein
MALRWGTWGAVLLLAMAVQGTAMSLEDGGAPKSPGVRVFAAPAAGDSSQAHPTEAADDNDRGCCVWHTEKKACAYTNRKYCVEKARQHGVSFDFHKDKECKAVADCPDKGRVNSGPSVSSHAGCDRS